jgi:hypothetical protein
MDYNYETLLDERFQMLCQSLLTREYRGVQCLPVGMPDGGQDAYAHGAAGSAKNSVVFQVKFTRNPNKVADPAKWLINVIKDEQSKIEELVAQGMERYIIMTNMPGTSHPGVGTIARVQEHLNEKIPVPAQCWWRDEIDRRLDTNFDLKLRYPSLLSGTDAIRLLWELTGANENQVRRESAIRAYLAYHYEQDQTVRFKEVGLTTSSLWDLFIDVPARPEEAKRRPSRESVAFYDTMKRVAALSAREEYFEAHPDTDEDPQIFVSPWYDQHRSTYVSINQDTHGVSVGAAAALLDAEFMSENSCILIEGAPGQGKSTLSQYLVQISRARLLDLKAEVAKLPAMYASSPLMMPIKLELRDIASWLNGINPWSTALSQKHDKQPTFEAAIAAHIERYSGGVHFDVSDLLGSLAETPALIVLDALDEVADLDDRRAVVEEVQAGITRLQQKNNQIRVIVTSRPTAITNAPAFPKEKFRYLSLAPISYELALDYAGRWANARGLGERDRADLQRALGNRLNTPHIAELAKNTMQLTILLTLINLRGPSLPDKRTALYDTYFDVFMNRESEKDVSVRENRELLIDLHRYLGYYLHSKAEAARSSGRITTEDLSRIISAYLAREGRSPDMVPPLFGSVDRMFALVSRVQGTWEFEVQPLQEYFAARYLYDTAPPSPTGHERPGTKPERFDGIAQNPYWLNVTRFFAGCFSKGELLDLSERVSDLITPPSISSRNLGLSLLQDWVFTQSVKATNRLLDRVFDHNGLRWAGIQMIYNGPTPGSGGPSLVLRPELGSEHLIDIAWPAILESPRSQRLAELCNLVAYQRANHDELVKKWNAELATKTLQEREEWLQVGSWLNLLKHLPPNQISSLVEPDQPSGLNERLAILLGSGVMPGHMPESVIPQAFRALLDSNFDTITPSPQSSARYHEFTWFSDPWLWISVASSRGNEMYYEGLDFVRRLHVTGRLERTSFRNNPITDRVTSLVDLIVELLSKPNRGSEFLETWSQACSVLNEGFGRTLLGNEIGVMAGGITSSQDRGNGAGDLLDQSRSLIDRIRFARGRLNHPDWWLRQLSSADHDYDRSLVLLACFAWASPASLESLLPAFEETVITLPETHRSGLVQACRRSAQYSSRAKKMLQSASDGNTSELTDPATLCIFYDRLATDRRNAAVQDYLIQNITQPYIADVVLEFAITQMLDQKLNPEEALPLASTCHEMGASNRLSMITASETKLRSLHSQWLNTAVDLCWTLPSDVLWVAYRSLSARRAHPEPVAKIAQRENWFADETS